MVRVGTNPALQALRVIGVAKDAVVSSPQHRNMVVLYENFWQFGPQIQEYPTLIVRSRFGGEVTAAVLEQPVAEGGREYASQSRTVHQQTEASLLQERLLATVRCGYAARISGIVRPLATRPTTVLTVMRRTADARLAAHHFRVERHSSQGGNLSPAVA
jgi:hypothetical protein